MRHLCFLLFLLPILLKGQDTTFIQKHSFTTPVRNVFVVGRNLYVKTGEGLYRMEERQWVKEKMMFEKTFVFYNAGFFESDYLPNEYIFDASSMAYLIPQKSITNASVAKLDDRFFVAAGGSLFEYAVHSYYRHEYKDFSIRDIYLDDSLKVISTYGGIFINDSLRAPEPGYSNGSFCKVKGGYFLCADQLYRFQAPAGFHKIESGENVFAGHSRKLVDYRGQVYAQNTKSINVLDSQFALTPIHQGFEYYDLEKVDSVLLFCTYSGEVFCYNGRETRLLFKLNSRVRDIYPFKNTVYFSADEGVYTLTDLKPSSLALLANTKLSVKVLLDLFNNTWIATENGLYVLPDKHKDPILFIEKVEFNRGALTYFNDNIYAGSIEGVFVINTYAVVKNFLPLYLNKKNNDASALRQKRIWIGSICVLGCLLLGYGFYFFKKRNSAVVSIPQKEEVGLTLEKIEKDILANNITTVDGLAAFYHTNTVQLNRQFKNFDSTPGKFLKQVKLRHAKILLKEGHSMEEVVAQIGYSAGYIKKELHL